MQFAGSLAQTTYNLNGGTVVYNSGAPGQTVIGTTYNHLTLNAGSKTLAATGTAMVNGNLTLDAISPLNMNDRDISLTGNLSLGSDITSGNGMLKITSAAANVTGAGFVQGSVERAHDFANNAPYRFNGQNIYLATTTQVGADLTLKMTGGTNPTGAASVSTKYAQRQYSLKVATNPLTLTQAGLYYASPAEELGGLNPNRVGIRFYNGTLWSKVVNTGRTSAGGLVTI